MTNRGTSAALIGDKRVESFDLLGVRISAINLPDATVLIESHIREKRKGYVCVCPVSTIVETVKDSRLREVVNSASLATPDGMPTVWMGKLSGYPNVSRVYGPDLMLAMCHLSEQRGYKSYFLGSTESALEKLRENLKKQFPMLNIVGSYSPPFRKLSSTEEQGMVGRINQADPEILWVALGSPKQEHWMYEHREALRAPMIIGVGAAFDFLSGVKKQAPRWVRNAGLEWLFRLCCEPRRLWKRYLVGNTLFILYLIRQSLINKRRDTSQQHV